MQKKPPFSKRLHVAIKPILARHPECAFEKGMLFFKPVGWYLRGIAFQRSQWSSDNFYVQGFVAPLVYAPDVISCIGDRVTLGSTGQETVMWSLQQPHIENDLIFMFEDEISHLVKAVSDGAAFLAYLQQIPDGSFSGSLKKPTYQSGLAHLHLGDLPNARAGFEAHKAIIAPPNQTGTPRFGIDLTQSAWFQNLLQLINLIDNEPSSIPAHCEAVARQALSTLKLEKYWDAPPFWKN
jgi:hypothetical protein